MSNALEAPLITERQKWGCLTKHLCGVSRSERRRLVCRGVMIWICRGSRQIRHAGTDDEMFATFCARDYKTCPRETFVCLFTSWHLSKSETTKTFPEIVFDKLENESDYSSG